MNPTLPNQPQVPPSGGQEAANVPVNQAVSTSPSPVPKYAPPPPVGANDFTPPRGLPTAMPGAPLGGAQPFGPPNQAAPDTYPQAQESPINSAAAPHTQVTAPPKAIINPNSTQNALNITEIRDGIVIMNDGSFRSVIMVKSINFDLMSPQEREAVEYSYQGFLNSLYFPVQIFIHSRKVDLGPYIQKLDKIRTEHENMLLALLLLRTSWFRVNQLLA